MFVYISLYCIISYCSYFIFNWCSWDIKTLYTQGYFVFETIIDTKQKWLLWWVKEWDKYWYVWRININTDMSDWSTSILICLTDQHQYWYVWRININTDMSDWSTSILICLTDQHQYWYVWRININTDMSDWSTSILLFWEI